MAQEPSPDSTPAKPEPQKHSLVSRLLAATAFSTVGAKIGLIGMVQDANAVLGKELTLGEKFRGVFNGKLFQKLAEKIEPMVVKENKSILKAYASVLKYTLITTAVGTVGGAVLGWVRGGRVENWKDIISHPIRSTKLIIGLEDPPAPKPHHAPAPAEPEAGPDYHTNHASAVLTQQKPNVIKPSDSHADAAMKQEAAELGRA